MCVGAACAAPDSLMNTVANSNAHKIWIDWFAQPRVHTAVLATAEEDVSRVQRRRRRGKEQTCFLFTIFNQSAFTAIRTLDYANKYPLLIGQQMVWTGQFCGEKIIFFSFKYLGQRKLGSRVKCLTHHADKANGQSQCSCVWERKLLHENSVCWHTLCFIYLLFVSCDFCASVG